jgi:hypothetical protein
MSRKAHLVGAWPGRGPEHAMEVALQQLSPYLARMTDGETGDRHLWITPVMEKFRANPDVELIRDGDWSDYDKIAQWKVRDGQTMDPENIRLPYLYSFENSFPSFQYLRERYDRPDLRFQVGIPMPLDLAVNAFGDEAFGDRSIIDPCTVATAREIGKIFAEGGDEVVFQIETVVALIAVAKVEPADQQKVAEEMAEQFVDLVSRCPRGARFGAHLCLGDFHHRAWGHMVDSLPLVLLANAIAAAWPDGGQILEYIHAPFAAAAEPPVPEDSFYEPLRKLALPDETRFIAGFQHETLDLEGHRELLARIEGYAGREVDVAAACGLGRRDTNQEAFDQMQETASLLGSPDSVPA